MSEPLFPPPPPPPPEGEHLGGFHLPGTNLTAPIRRRLEALEQPSHFDSSLEPNRGFVAGFLLGAPSGVVNAVIWRFGIVPAVGSGFGPIFFSCYIGEAFKLFCMLVVALLMWRVVPNRRYGAALGAAVGLGFGLGGEVFVQAISGFNAEHVVVALMFIPLMDVISAALIGLGVFVFVANKQKQVPFVNSVLGLPLFFFVLAGLGWGLWNVLAIAASANYAVSWLVDILITIPLFVFILRDFLGGHFNLANFLKPLPEPTGSSFSELPPPPPPPPP